MKLYLGPGNRDGRRRHAVRPEYVHGAGYVALGFITLALMAVISTGRRNNLNPT